VRGVSFSHNKNGGEPLNRVRKKSGPDGETAEKKRGFAGLKPVGEIRWEPGSVGVEHKKALGERRKNVLARGEVSE